MKKFYPLIPIFLLNILPIAGVLFLGWDVYSLIYIFWLESLFIGVFNLLKMGMAKKSTSDSVTGKVFSKVGLMIFFCFHYFFFLLILGVFVFSMVIINHDVSSLNFDIRLVSIMLIAGCTSHFITDYILPKKYLTTVPSDLFFSPYSRVWILAALIFAGGFISHNGMGNQYFYLLILVLAKLLADILTYYIHSYSKTKQAGPE